MRIIILLACCAWLASADTVPQKCDGVTFNGKYYDQQVLLTVIRMSLGGFSYDNFTNTLFFSYYYTESKNNDHAKHLAYFNIDSKQIRDIPEVSGGSTTEVDSETGDVYLGGTDGIYKFNYQNKTAVPYAAAGVNINYLYYSCAVLYYTTFPDFKIYSYDGKETKKVSDIKVDKFIGDDDKYFFFNTTGLYRVLDDNEENAEIFSDSSDGYKFFAKDNNGNVFVTGEDCVYVPNEEKKKFDKIADIEGIRDLVFDKNSNNIFYSNENSIYRLTPSEKTCPAGSLS